jgi:ABC-type amino acid transport substrate-binding protein
MKREIAVGGIVAGIVVGFLLGWIIPPLLTNPSEKPLIDQILSRGQLIVGTSADYPPFENKTYPGGNIIGFDIDLSQWIADELSVSLLMVDIPFDSLIAACRSGTVDMIAAAMTYTEDRAKRLDPSVTYITVSQVVVVKNSSVITIGSIEDLTSYDVGVQTGTVMYEELVDLGMTPGLDLYVYDNANDLMTALDSGGVDAIYIDEPVFTAWQGTYNIKIIFSTGSEPLALWTRLGEPKLLYVMNKVILDSYLDGSMYDLINLWFGNYTG